jgi:hypothetical protein
MNMFLSILNSLHSDSYLVMVLSLIGMFVLGYVFTYPGLLVTESQKGAIPIPQLGFQTAKFVGTALRGPTNLPIYLTSYKQFVNIFGPRTSTSHLHDAVRMWFENVDAGCYVVRAINSGAVKATYTLVKGGTKQVETATIVGTISGAGNATVTVTAAAMAGSPRVISVAVALSNAAAAVAGKIRTALAADAVVNSFFTVSGTSASVILTARFAAANDATMNLAFTNGTCTGLKPDATSDDTTAGVAGTSILRVDSYGPGADYNFAALAAHGISVNYVAGILTVYDAGVLKEQFRNVTYDKYGASTNFINGHSEVIQIAWLDTTQNPDDPSAPVGLASGADGTDVTATEIIGSEGVSPKTGIYAFATKNYPLGFHMAPGYTTATVGNALIESQGLQTAFNLGDLSAIVKPTPTPFAGMLMRSFYDRQAEREGGKPSDQVIAGRERMKSQLFSHLDTPQQLQEYLKQSYEVLKKAGVPEFSAELDRLAQDVVPNLFYQLEQLKIREASSGETTAQAIERLGSAASGAAGKLNFFNPSLSVPSGNPGWKPNAPKSEFNFGLPKKPRLFARGGIATRPTLGIFGEAGPEAILPLSKMNFMMAMANVKSSQNPVPIHYAPIIHAAPGSDMGAIQNILRQQAGELVRMVQLALNEEDRETQLAV